MRTKEANEIKMPIFRERFCSLRGSKTQAEFAEFIGVSRPTVGFYENGERLPDALVLRKIAEKCGVSADWLLGLSDVKSTDQNKKIACEVTGLSEENVEFLSKLYEYQEVCEKACQLKILSWGEWERKHSYTWYINELLSILHEYRMREVLDLLHSLNRVEENSPSKEKYPDEDEMQKALLNGLENFSGVGEYLFNKGAVVLTSMQASRFYRQDIQKRFSSLGFSFLSNALEPKNEPKSSPNTESIALRIFILKKQMEKVKGGEQNANDHTEERDI